MNKNVLIKVLVVVILIVILGLIVKFGFFSEEGSSTNNYYLAQTSESEAVEIVETSTSLSLSSEKSENYSTYDAKINLSTLNVEGTGASISNNTITIGQEGTYYFTGTLNDGNIVVDSSKSNIVLVFENAEITCSKTAVINVVSAKKVTINLAEGSTNVFTDGTEYTVFTDTDEPNSTIFSKSDLVFSGKGTIKINANYEKAIKSTDSIAIVDCTMVITATDEGIRGKDYVSINNANIKVVSGGDGIKSTNDEDAGLGYVIISASKIDITAEGDGIQAETVLNMKLSEINITTTGEVENDSNDGFRISYNSTSTSSEKEGSSSKALKAGKEITINSGTYNINSTDDAIHSNGYVIINGGSFNISTGDDGIHADVNVLINNGTINIAKSYEGIEANYIKINDGDIKVYASDDGINVSGGAQNEGMNMGGNSREVNENERQLQINGGTIYVKATGDGLDANGSIVINGGDITVAGTTNNGNGALDYDNVMNVNGGSLIVYGATGMWLNPSSSSKQYCIAFGVSGSSSDSIVLKDSSGNEITSFTADNNYGAVIISNSNLKKDETYTLYVNGSKKDTIEVTSNVTSNVGENGGMMQGGRQMMH